MSVKGQKIMTMTYNDFLSSFYPSILGLGGFRVKNMETMINIAKTKKKCDQKNELFEELREKLLTETCLKEGGKPKTEEGKFIYKDDTTREVALDKVKKLSEQEIEVVTYPVKWKDVKNIQGITANMMVALGGEYLTGLKLD